VITEATPRQCALELEALPSRIQQVRRIVAAQLRYWRLEPLLDNTLLGITELLANVHRHAQPDKKCQVELTFASGWLTVAVTDSDPRLPRVREFEPLATCGRGLAMVVSMSDSWGTEAVSDGGKVVWFTLRAEAPGTGRPPVGRRPRGDAPGSRRHGLRTGPRAPAEAGTEARTGAGEETGTGAGDRSGVTPV